MSGLIQGPDGLSSTGRVLLLMASGTRLDQIMGDDRRTAIRGGQDVVDSAVASRAVDRGRVSRFIRQAVSL